MKVGLFVTCLVDLMRPSIGFASLKLLESAGYEVMVPANQTCCGQPGYNSGDRKAAQALGKKMLKEFSGCDYIVVPSGSCGGMIRAHYPGLLAEFPELTQTVEAIARKTYELTDFLLNVARVDSVPGQFGGTVTYHDSCSGLREMNVKAQPRALLSKVAGLRISEMQQPEQCCGFGGTFAVKNSDVSAAICADKVAAVRRSGAEVLCAADNSCLMHIGGALARVAWGAMLKVVEEIKSGSFDGLADAASGKVLNGIFGGFAGPER